MGVTRTAAAVVLALTIACPAGADPVLDQAVPHPGGASGHGTVAGDISQGQTFTVGVTGVFSALDLFITRFPDYGFGPLLIDIRPTVGGLPVDSDSLALARVAVDAVAVPVGFGNGEIHVDFSGEALTVVSGQLLAFVVRSPGTVRQEFVFPQYSLFAVDSDYPGGQPYERAPSLGMPAFRGTDAFADYAFRTYVEPAAGPIPEPASILLLGGGLAALAARRARRA